MTTLPHIYNAEQLEEFGAASDNAGPYRKDLVTPDLTAMDFSRIRKLQRVTST
jgi:hypothetical protein